MHPRRTPWSEGERSAAGYVVIRSHIAINCMRQREASGLQRPQRYDAAEVLRRTTTSCTTKLTTSSLTWIIALTTHARIVRTHTRPRSACS